MSKTFLETIYEKLYLDDSIVEKGKLADLIKVAITFEEKLELENFTAEQKKIFLDYKQAMYDVGCERELIAYNNGFKDCLNIILECLSNK